jgi:hypothetical protein
MAVKYPKWPNNIPNGRKIFQMVVKYTYIIHSKAFQDLPKLDFWHETKPSGSPGLERRTTFAAFIRGTFQLCVGFLQDCN